MRRLGVLLIVLLIALVMFSTSADAQCAMCRAVLTNQNNSQFIRNFNIGILVLLIPPVSIFCSIFIVLRRHRGENGSTKSDSTFD